MATHSSVLAWRIPGMGSLVGCRLWGQTESDMTEVTQQQQQLHTRMTILSVLYHISTILIFVIFSHILTSLRLTWVLQSMACHFLNFLIVYKIMVFLKINSMLHLIRQNYPVLHGSKYFHPLQFLQRHILVRWVVIPIPNTDIEIQRV